MGTTYTGKKIKDTYKSIIKISDNSEADANGKQLSDGNGNDLGVYVDTDGVLGIGAAASVSLDISSKTDAIHLPKGTTTDRGSVTAISGMVRFNTSTTKFEVYDGAWKNIFTESGGTISGDLIITGDLTVNGTTTTINTETVEFEDNILQLNTTQGTPDTATATTSGISIYRGDGVTQASFIFDDADDTWDLTNNLTVDGNVGVNTDEPNNDLQVEASSNGKGITIHRNSSTTDSYGELSFLNSTNAAAAPTVWLRGNRGVSNANYLTLGTADTERARVDSSGNLGIGTTSPTQKLHVDGNARVTGAIYDSTNSAGTSGAILTSTGSGINWSDVGSMSTLRLRSAASQNADATTDIAIQWDTQEIAPDSSFTHSTTADNSRIQVTNSGKYLVTGYLNYNGNTTNYRFTSRISIRVNGTNTLDDFFDGTYVRGSNLIHDHGHSFNLVVDLSASDYIEVLSKRTSGTTGNATISEGTNISVVRLSGVKGEKGDLGGVTISNFGDNRIITSSSTADNANAENNLTFDGSTLHVSGDMEVTDHVHAGQGVLSFSDTGNKTLDASSYGVFIATGNVATATYTINNLKSGQVIDIVFTGTLSSAVITLDSGFTTDTFYQLGATTFNTSSQNHIQLVCIDDTDSAAIINYSVANFTGSNDVNP
jgi:hypothetical protein